MVEGYHTILADPPWPERGGGRIRRGADRHYKLMSVSEILSFLKKLPIADDAHIYLWATNNHLKDGLYVLESLGFRYVTNIVWVKTDNRLGLGQYFRGQHELCLFGVKGKLPYRVSEGPLRSRTKETTVILAPRRRHSQKPAEIYRKIEATSYPPYLEVFARERRQGWDAIGDELPDTAQTVLFGPKMKKS
jgi:N6-adenosine-specific RNA methylase IME4